MATFFRDLLVPVGPPLRQIVKNNKLIQCNIAPTAVVKDNKIIQCNIVLTARIQAEKERKAAQRVKSTQTFHVLPRGKSVKSQTAGKAESCSTCATQTDDIEVVGTGLDRAIYVLKSFEEFSNLSLKIFEDKHVGKKKLLITDPSLQGAAGYNGDPISLCLDEDGMLHEKVLIRSPKCTDVTEKGSLDLDSFTEHVKDFFCKGNIICEGLQDEEAVDMTSRPRGLTLYFFPNRHLRSQKCTVWFKPSGGMRICRHCRTGYALLKAKNKQMLTTPINKSLRRYLSSSSRLSFLTPKTKKKRLQAKRIHQYRLQKKVKKLTDRVDLSEEQSRSLQNIVNTINIDFKETLDEVIGELDGHAQTSLRNVWERDSQARDKLSKETHDFFADQCKNKTGVTNNSWSTITYRLALAVFCRSPAAYQALKSFGVLQLPSMQSLRDKSAKYNEKPGINHTYLAEQTEKYRMQAQELAEKGHPEPQCDGILIFDEVKVINKVTWNSKSKEFVGLAMSPEEAPHLHDIFRGMSANGTDVQAAQYVVQFFWRDLTSHFDVIGPYYSSAKAFDHNFMMGCVMETMSAFHCYGFRISGLVCDGAPENLKVIKQTMGHTGVFGHRATNTGFEFAIEPSFESPFTPGSKVYWVICPSHQLKNMVAALHSSRPGGTKNFLNNKTYFGWEEIIAMKRREDARGEQNIPRRVPDLTESDIDRDSWTRLNVKPAKIMQQVHVLRELFDHVSSRAPGFEKTAEVHAFLSACNKIFETGFFSKERVCAQQRTALNNIAQGYSFFESWLKHLLTQDAAFQPNKSTQRLFLSWQTWDLLRVCVFGIHGLSEQFFAMYPKHFLVFSRINGSDGTYVDAAHNKPSH